LCLCLWSRLYVLCLPQGSLLEKLPSSPSLLKFDVSSTCAVSGRHQQNSENRACVLIAGIQLKMSFPFHRNIDKNEPAL
jgi:hypothetical protein